MGDHISMSISVCSLSDETLNRGPPALSCDDSMNFPLELMYSAIFNFQCPSQTVLSKPDTVIPQKKKHLFE